MVRMKKIVTCALPYANGVIHLGHLAGSCLPSDIYARFCRLQGEQVHFVSGADEFGMPITLSAKMAGKTPKEHVDEYFPKNQALFEKLHFSFDHFVRTSWKGHQAPVQKFFLDLLEQGYIEPRMTQHLYSEEDDQFLADRFVQGTCPKCGFEEARGDECPRCAAAYEASSLLNPCSKISGSPLVLKETKHWYLRLDLFKDQLKKWIAQHDWKPNVLNFIQPYIDDLQPRAITRDSDWGVPVPLEEAKGKVLYVWFDAPIGYISASMQWAQNQGDADGWKKFWCDPKTQLVQFLGKDNIPFHAIIFPAMIMGQKERYKLVDALPANEFYHLEGKKFSKSQGWSIDLEEMLSHFDPDLIRYTLAASAPESSDSEFTWKEFQMRTNAELVGKWGNFIHRTLTFLQKSLGGKVVCLPKLSPESEAALQQSLNVLNEVKGSYENFTLRGATKAIVSLAQVANGYFDQMQPWKLAKDPEKREELVEVMAVCLRMIELSVLALSPIAPGACQRAWQLLGLDGKVQEQNWKNITQKSCLCGVEGKILPKPMPIFSKVEDEQVEQFRQKLFASQSGA